MGSLPITPTADSAVVARHEVIVIVLRGCECAHARCKITAESQFLFWGYINFGTGPHLDVDRPRLMPFYQRSRTLSQDSATSAVQSSCQWHHDALNYFEKFATQITEVYGMSWFSRVVWCLLKWSKVPIPSLVQNIHSSPPKFKAIRWVRTIVLSQNRTL